MANENMEVLKKVAELLLDENEEAIVETTYLRDTPDKRSIEYTTEPGIPTKNGKYTFWAGMSENAHRARSVKIGKYSMSKVGTRGFNIITPEGEKYFFEGDVLHNRTTAAYVWAAALDKCDNNYTKVRIKLDGLSRLGDIKATPKGPKESKFEKAKKQLKSLGVPEKQMKNLMSKREHEGI